MMRLLSRAALCAFVVLLLAGSQAQAKGIPSRVTITGPGLAAPVSVTDPVALPFLGLWQLENVQAPLAAAPPRAWL
jgi:hypothetical protein